MNPQNNQQGSGLYPGDQNPEAVNGNNATSQANQSPGQMFQPTVSTGRQQTPIMTPDIPQDGPDANAQPPQQPNTPQNSLNPKQSKSKVIPVMIVSVIVLMLITVAAVIATSGSKKSTPKPAVTTQQTNVGPQPAAAIDVDQSNNSINQDMSSLKDEEDFPSTQLDDKSLGL